MSTKLGPVYYHQSDIEKLSPAMKDLIDEEVRLILETSYARVFDLLTKRRPQLQALANALLEKETLSIDEIKQIIGFRERDLEPPANSSKSTFRFTHKITTPHQSQQSSS